MSNYYTYTHHAGYGSDDHMADEIIARAARHLGLAGSGDYVLAAVGMASHAVPMGSALVEIPAAAGVRRRMESALRDARREVRRNDCWISVECQRRTRCGEYRCLEVRRDRQWVELARERIRDI